MKPTLALRTTLLLAPLAALHAQDFTLGDTRTLPEPKTNLSIYDYAPDGHYTVFWVGALLGQARHMEEDVLWAMLNAPEWAFSP